MPRLARIPARILFVALGLAIALGVLAYDAWRSSPLDAPKLVIIALGLATSAALAFHDRRIRGVPLASALLWSVPLAWGPLCVWAAQGAMKTAWGTTPLEAFTHYALLLPLTGALSILGHSPTLDGSVVTYLTPSGPIALEVGVACSGIQAMALFGGILLALLLVERPPLRAGIAWCAIGLGGVYVVNVIRLVALALVGSRWGIAALEAFHANAGWMFFLAWSALFTLFVVRQGARRTMPT
jgi:exosortase/archaeosortase family protein